VERTSKVRSLREAAALVADGMTVGIGGYLATNKPGAFVREIIRRRVRDLTVVSPVSSLEVDLLIGAGCVRRVVTGYVGAEAVCPIGPCFRRAAQEGRIQVGEVDAGIVLTMLRAATWGVPSLPWKGGLGTSLPEVNPDLKLAADPFTGEPVVAVRAVAPDVALVHAAQADAHGNVRHLGRVFGDALMARASGLTLVSVECLVPNADVRKAPAETSLPPVCVTAVVEAPFGAHPFGCGDVYRADEAHLREYVAAAEAWGRGDDGGLAAYLDRYVFGPETHEDYLARVGREHLATLREA